jgi:hypothetical protein
MNRDLTVYTYHPRPRLLWAPMVIIAAMAILGFVRGLMGSADLSLEPGFANHGQTQKVGVEPRPVLLETIPSLTPRLIGIAPPAPKAPVAVNAPVVQTTAGNAVNAPATIAPPPLVKAEAVPAEAAPTTPTPPSQPAPPPTPLQGLY